MEARSKWLWGVTLANVAVAFLLIIALYAIMMALAVIAPEISGWPLYVILPLGVALSIIGLRFTRAVASHTWRYISYSVNGCILALHLFMIFGFVALFMSSTKERFLIPDGYKGEVYVVYGVPDGEALHGTRWAVTYRIPKDGVLRVQGPLVRSWTRTEYDYQTDSGKLERIRNFWPTTIHRTTENLSNDRDIGVFFPRTGKFTDSTGCSVEYQLFYVGTKAHLLTKYKRLDIATYIGQHPVGCNGPPK
jgi:hypothetical protein